MKYYRDVEYKATVRFEVDADDCVEAGDKMDKYHMSHTHEIRDILKDKMSTVSWSGIYDTAIPSVIIGIKPDVVISVPSEEKRDYIGYNVVHTRDRDAAEMLLLDIRSWFDRFGAMSFSELLSMNGETSFPSEDRVGWTKKFKDDFEVVHTQLGWAIKYPRYDEKFHIDIPEEPVKKPERMRKYILKLKDENGNAFCDILTGACQEFDSMNDLYEYIFDKFISNKYFEKCIIRNVTVSNDEDGVMRFSVPVTGYFGTKKD